MLRIVQLLPRMHEGGAERGAADLVREQRGAAEHIIIAEKGQLAAEVINEGGRFLPFPMASKNILTVPRRAAALRSLLRELSPDIVHVRSRVPAWLHYFANRQLHIPTVSTVHGINSVNAYSRVMVLADAIICPGSAVAAHIRTAYGVQNSTVIGRGINIAYFDPAAVRTEEVTRLREEWNLAGKKVILHVGRLSAQKGHEVLLQTLARLPDNYAAVIVGKGTRLARLQTLARRLGVAARANFVGARLDMREMYALADVAVSCAIKPESFGRTIAEALAMRVPMIAADHGGARDIIVGECGGKLIPPGDSAALAAALLLPPPDVAAARTRIQSHFTAKQMANATLAVYQKVLAARR